MVIALPAPLHAPSGSRALPSAPVTIGVALMLALLVGAKAEAIASAAALALGGYALLKAAAAVQPARAAALLALAAVPMVPREIAPAALAMLALAAALDRRYSAMMMLAGLAFGLGAFAALPFFFAIAIARHIRFRLCAAGVAIAIVTLLLLPPAAAIPALILPGQLLGLALAIGAGVLATFVAQGSVLVRSDRAVLPAALLAALMMSAISPIVSAPTGVLPAALALVIAATTRTRMDWGIAGLAQIAAFTSVLYVEPATWLGVIIMLGSAILVARPLLRPAANDNPLLARAT